MKNNESEEMYLETILRLKQRKSYVRSVDIVEELGYVKSSVSVGVKLLKEKGYIKVGDDGVLNFTESGYKKASAVYERHCVLTEAFMKIGADRKLAEEDACRIEHVISDELFELLKKYMHKD